MKLRQEGRRIADLLRVEGFGTGQVSDKLTKAIRLGAKFEDILAAAKASQDRSNVDKPLDYGLQILINQLEKQPPTRNVDLRDAPQSVVEARALELGIGKWVAMNEQWPSYLARVLAAAKREVA